MPSTPFPFFPRLFCQLPFEKAESGLCHVPANCPLPRVLGELKVFVFFLYSASSTELVSVLTEDNTE